MNRLLCLCGVLGLISVAQTANAARLQPSVLVGQPAPVAVTPQPVSPPVVITVPDPTALSASCCPEKCCPTPCITYRWIVTYDYTCGFRIVFTFDRAGDLLVTYHY